MTIVYSKQHALSFSIEVRTAIHSILQQTTKTIHQAIKNLGHDYCFRLPTQHDNAPQNNQLANTLPSSSIIPNIDFIKERINLLANECGHWLSMRVFTFRYMAYYCLFLYVGMTFLQLQTHCYKLIKLTSWVLLQPCILEAPYLILEFSESTLSHSVTGDDWYAPMTQCGFEWYSHSGENPRKSITTSRQKEQVKWVRAEKWEKKWKKRKTAITRCWYYDIMLLGTINRKLALNT